MGPPSLPPYAFVVDLVLGSWARTGAGLGVVRIITSGERALTGQTLITEFPAGCSAVTVTLRSWHIDGCPVW